MMFQKEFDYTALAAEDRAKIHNELATSTLKHIQASNGLFTSLDYDEAQNHSQALEITHLVPVPVMSGEVAELASIARPELFQCIQKELNRQSAFVSAARFILNEQGINIFPVTNHSSIEDVAVWAAAWGELLPDESRQDQSGLIISRGVTTIGAFGTAASQVVQKIGHVFMSFPRTDTIANLGFDESLISTNNRNMRKEIHSWLGQDLIHKVRRHKLGRVLNIAWSGKTDMIIRGNNDKPASITLGNVSGGTIDIVKRGLTLPVVLWQDDEPYVEIGELTKIENQEDVLRVQSWQKSVLSKVTGLPEDKVDIKYS